MVMNEVSRSARALMQMLLAVLALAVLRPALAVANKSYEFFEYEGGGHNINSPYFEAAMERTIAFFQENL